MGTLKLEISEEILRALKFPPEDVEGELRKELALALYERGVLSLGKARQLVGMTRWQFEELLGQRKVTRHYTEEDLAEDLTYAQGDR
jgi:predicted HTH domain antitoxin